jgi:hypothetical protein
MRTIRWIGSDTELLNFMKRFVLNHWWFNFRHLPRTQGSYRTLTFAASITDADLARWRPSYEEIVEVEQKAQPHAHS